MQGARRRGAPLDQADRAGVQSRASQQGEDPLKKFWHGVSMVPDRRPAKRMVGAWETLVVRSKPPRTLAVLAPQFMFFKAHSSPVLSLAESKLNVQEFALFTQALKNDIIEAVFNTKCVRVKRQRWLAGQARAAGLLTLQVDRA